ncbi:cysteine-rich CWC family protein [Rhodoferax sp. TBRC 17660]|uniref:Cysteine-rich CWC family protein n=1 Tax=Rhodoferax potami TaxID=3068338 RepID=A0ABU3KN43_9BURK|nr:cysteine-rich CWC family protein [Rhodoferax sp. TBRC 17660]MDT7519221.1 cysteine-rich CWC family protein [Rhodoferax sp. TBRC 17660]
MKHSVCELRAADGYTANTMTTPPTINPQVCPVCGKANQCAMELAKSTGQAQGPCWCTQVSFSAELLGRIPPQAQGLACVCADCATQSGAAPSD